jgi:hypothetical protein
VIPSSAAVPWSGEVGRWIVGVWLSWVVFTADFDTQCVFLVV